MARRAGLERAWDRREGVIEPKSRAGRRAVPIVAALRSHLAARKLRRGNGSALFFGEGSQPFNRNQLVTRAEKAWKKAGLEPIGLHEGRHTFASILIAAGVNAKASRCTWGTARSRSPSTDTDT